MDALEAIRKRRSVRRYQDKPVERSLIEQLIDCGRLAPTAVGQEPWEFIVVTDPDARAELADIADYGKFIRQAPVCVAVFCKDTKYYLEDGSAATENIMLAATALGLGSCWVAGDKKAYAGKIADLLGVPEGYKLVSLIAVGYPAEQPQKTKRPLEEVLHWERF